jgi:hypothetical protein
LETEAQLITWTDNLTGNVEIQLFKADVFHSSISSGTPSDGQHPWNPPASTTSGDDYRIKILSVDDGNVFDLSDANFTIINNNFKVITPNGGENWLANTSQDITWTTDISGNVKIDLYKGGVFDSQIIASIPESNNLYSWAIPGSTATGSDYKIRITSIDNPVLFDESDASFTIFTGGITVNSPNGGESWQAGETHPITWTDNITENVKIDLYKGGVFHTEINPSTTSDGISNWDIPFDLESGSDYRVKITNVNYPGLIFDFSNADFTIVANQITITSPNGGEVWLETEDQLITWTDNFTGSVEIQLFKGGVFHSSITVSTPSDGQHPWNPPASTPSGDDYRIKILSVDDGNVFDLSDANFTIINNDLTVTSPNGGENWLTGTTQQITWTDDITENVKIELYKAEAFYSTIVSSTSSDGTYDWDIPGGTPTASDYKVKISSVDQPALFDMSNASFTIFTGGITVNSPNGGESWTAGTIQDINWADNITEDVKIDLYKGGSFHTEINQSTTSDGRYNWTIPFDLESGNDYKVKITSVDNPGLLFDFSDADFTIIDNQVTVTSPNGGEQWLDTDDQLITWTDNLTGNVEIQLFKNDVFHSSITTSTPSDGEYTWNIPGNTPSGDDYKVKILSADDGNIFDMSDGSFEIINNEITVISPNGGESWLVGSTHQITWSDNINGNVKIDLYKLLLQLQVMEVISGIFPIL